MPLSLKPLLASILDFTRHGSKLQLRQYQQEVAHAVLDSVINSRGDAIVVMFPRQSGKNELQAQLEAYLLVLLSRLDAEMVKASPTWKPQTQNAMRRLERVLKKNALTRHRWVKESGYIYAIGSARMFFLSGSPTSSVVGATATHLLECDEAQDVVTSKWDKEFSPMAASRNATRVFWGTAWTSKTLLARELRAARQAESLDGRRRAFVLTADDVRQEVPEYGLFVDGQIARLGRNHPMVRTQFYSEEIDSEAGMFPASRQALMHGDHPPMHAPRRSPLPLGRGAGGEGIYCLLLDVAGEDEYTPSLENGEYANQLTLPLPSSYPSAVGGPPSFEWGQPSSPRSAVFGPPSFGWGQLSSPSRDLTALTVVEIDLSTLTLDLVQAPTYPVVSRQQWVGVKHTHLYAQLIALARHWDARYLVVDATGVGAGLASFLDKALPGKVIPFVFTQKSKSDLGWSFIAVVETGHYKEYGQDRGFPSYNLPPNAVGGTEGGDVFRLQQVFWQQVESCQSQILEGPGKIMRWGVPDGYRDPLTGELVHCQCR